MQLNALSPREASIFACLTEAFVQPRPPLPPVRDTDAIAFFDRWMERSPARNRAGLRALLYAIEVGPRVTGRSRRLRRLDPAARASYLRTIETARVATLRQLAKLIKGMTFVSYYGDDRVLRQVGYDPDGNLERGRRLRTEEGRP